VFPHVCRPVRPFDRRSIATNSQSVQIKFYFICKSSIY